MLAQAGRCDSFRPLPAAERLSCRDDVALARELADLGVASTVLDMDHVFHQGTARYLNGMRVVQSPLLSERPFYRLSPWRQARVVAQARPLARGWLDGMDGVVAFNDGALQRVVLGIARARGLQTDLVLDGMITYVDAPPSMSAILRHGLQAIGRHADRVHRRLPTFRPRSACMLLIGPMSRVSIR